MQALANQGDSSGIARLIEAEETLWKKAPSITYFQNMFAIGDVLIGGTNPNMYWLGRKVLWNMLSKPAPNEDFAPQEYYMYRIELFFSDAEDITTYVNNLSPDMFASVRHDTFLMLAEYARQLHATIVPGYRDKYTGGFADRHRFMQNAIDNQVQSQAKKALSLLATDHTNYLIEAYSHDPRNDQELETLLDILNVQGADRETVMRNTR